jgi:hypothetical protein
MGRIGDPVNILKAVTVFIGKVLCDAPTLESQAYHEGFADACDQMAPYLIDGDNA